VKLLIDECLTPALVEVATAHGFYAAHVAHLGLAGSSDWKLMAVILEGDWTFVTRNADDFRGPGDAPGSRGVYSGRELHAGLICLSLDNVDAETQSQVFDAVLRWLGPHADLVNRGVEAEFADDGDLVVSEYALQGSP
jgi:predicted nuclease of predicted toxin-antitoxin system